MVVVEEEPQVIERVGGIDFTIRRAEDSPESRQRPARRAEVLAAWLLAQWRHQHAEDN